MEVAQRAVNLSGRDIHFRPISFERYRKPQVVEYPRHAVVLNPHYTQVFRQSQQAPHLGGETKEVGGSDEEDASSSENRRLTEDADDDDPCYMDTNTFLCTDRTLQQLLFLQWREVGRAGIGLVNFGNTCYANSVLQALAYTPAIAQYFASTFKAPDRQIGAPYDFAYALGEVIRHVHLSPRDNHDGGAYRPAPVVGNLKALSSQFAIGRQSDAHEFAVQLLFSCQKSILFRQVGSKKLPSRVAQTTALLRICGGYLRSQVSWERQEEIGQLLRAGKRQEATDLKLEGQSGSGHPTLHSNTYDPCTILNVEIAGHTLEHCLAKFCEVETLDGRTYHTPRGVGVHATKRFTIHSPPQVLMIHLKRFRATGGKISKYIQYGTTLDLTPFCTPQEGRNRNALHRKVTYELNAICVHDGNSVSFGHYYCIVRARNKLWYECNDTHVRPISEELALRQQAYMLFYSAVPSKARAEPTPSRRKSGLPARLEERLRRSTLEGTEADLGTELAEVPVGHLGAVWVTRAVTAASGMGSKGSDSVRGPRTVVASPFQSVRDKRSVDSSSESEEERRQRLPRRRNVPELLASVLPDDETQDASRRSLVLPTATPSHGLSLQAGRQEDRPSTPASACASVAQDGEVMVRRDKWDSAEVPKKKVYGGVIKAMRRRDGPRTSLRRASTDVEFPNPIGAGEALAESANVVAREGIQAVVALERRKAYATPSTVRRLESAPKFQQRVRDPLWEMEMDRGRVKKVKAKKVDHRSGSVNPFQEASLNKFDSLGRNT